VLTLSGPRTDVRPLTSTVAMNDGLTTEGERALWKKAKASMEGLDSSPPLREAEVTVSPTKPTFSRERSRK
jgi:hypothetical protein